MNNIKKFEILYAINELPPPFSHQYTIKGELSEDTPLVDFKVEYTGREDLSEEEIYEEGFSPDDDFSWQGKLKPVWNKEIQKVFSKIELKKIKTSGIHLKLTDSTGKTIEGNPTGENIKFFLEELIQAVYVTTGKEIPFTIVIKKVKGQNEGYQLKLTPDFSEKKITLIISKDKVSDIKTEYPWDKLNKLLKEIFSLDFYPEEALEKEPSEKGIFIDPGEGLWYKFGKSIKNPGKIKLLESLEEKFDNIASHG